MISCGSAAGSTWHCPTADELAPQGLALLPRGRAWATSDGAVDPSSVLVRFWRGVTDTFAFGYARWCALREEFWCATQTETNPEWLAEYGLPDACDPFPDLCAKVAALGGSTCDYLVALAARAGWSISCADPCGAEAGCAEAGLAVAGSGTPNGTLILAVHVLSSPAYVAVTSQAEAGCLEAGATIVCDPFDGLRCLLDRAVHAHLAVQFVTIQD